MKPLAVSLPVVPEPESVRSKMRIASRQARRLHMARMGEQFLPWRNQYEREPQCTGCGTESSNYTEDCEICQERRRGRGRRRAAGAPMRVQRQRKEEAPKKTPRRGG